MSTRTVSTPSHATTCWLLCRDVAVGDDIDVMMIRKPGVRRA